GDRARDVSRDPQALGHRAGRLAGDAPPRRRGVRHRDALLALGAAADRRALPPPRQARLAARAQEPEGARHADEDAARAQQLLRPRAVIVVTGSELVRGERTDLNGPFLAREVERLGIEAARIDIVGDSPAELERVLRAALADGDAVLTSGGLGPTHDDRTVELVAAALGVGLHVEPELEAQIEGVSRAAAERMRRNYADFAPGVTKQATVPDGAVVVGLAGTAPALLVPREGGRFVVILPGPPSELQRLWPAALDLPPFRELLARTRAPSRRQLRFFGVSESAIAQALVAAGGDGDGVELTICARDFEIHVDVVVEQGAERRADELEARLLPPIEQWLYARDGRGVEERVLELCRARGWTLATAESCT